MKKLLTIILKILLIFVILVAIGWYLLGEDGPYHYLIAEPAADNGAAMTEETQPKQIVEDEEETEPVVEAEPEEYIPTRVVFTGDVNISDAVKAIYDEKGINGVIDSELLETLKSADFTMINNEFPFSDRGVQAPDKKYTFRLDPKYVSFIEDLGTDVAGLANNHVLDYGKDSLTDTLTTLDNAGIERTGAGISLEDAARLVVKTDRYGRTYGFLASSHVIPVYEWDVKSSQPGVFTFYDPAQLYEEIEKDSKLVDYLFVMVHWGNEHTIELTDYQQNEGHGMIDHGAYAVIGMHSHCLQPVEIYEGKPIFYSLGNFIFGPNTKSGAAVELTIEEDQSVVTRIIPVKSTDGFTAPTFGPGDRKIFDYIQEMSFATLVDDNGIITPTE